MLPRILLSTVNVEDVGTMLRKYMATGLDNIPARFVNDAAEQIAPSITHIVNISIQQGKVPQDLKFAKVTPLYKNVVKQNLEIMDLSLCSASFQKYWNE